ncbi:Ent-kaurene oxidase protein [Rutstroemia sp. NJR-2017a BVV2]|nr:Ent-kaurene oxidase protein [Rutstroemia sp. NJR-2017a BVV2]
MDAVFNIIPGMEHWTSQITLSAIVVGLAVIWARYTSKAQIPRVGISPGFFNYNLKKAKAEFAQHGIKLLQDGYNRFNNSPFLVQTSNLERIVLPVKYLEELRSCPESQLSHREGICDRFLGYYTGLDVVRQSTLHNEVCQTQLVQSLPSYLPGMVEEVQLAISEILKLEGTEMTSIDYNAVYHIHARLNSRVLVGLPLCRDDEWIRVSEEYPHDVFVVAADLRNYTPLLRPFVAPFLASTKRLRSHQRIAEEKLVPLIRQRQMMGKSTKPSNLLEWMVDLAKGEDAKPSNLVQKMLFLTMATFHASTATAVHVLYDLCSYPEYAQVLRDEINGELAAADGEWPIGVIHRLKRLDSFLKESQRFNPPGSRK